MPRARKYESNAERQAAYRRRKAAESAGSAPRTHGERALVTRVLAADERAREAEQR